VLYLVLSQYNNEQSNLMHTLALEKTLPKLPMYESLLKLFITKEIFHFTDVRAGDRSIYLSISPPIYLSIYS